MEGQGPEIFLNVPLGSHYVPPILTLQSHGLFPHDQELWPRTNKQWLCRVENSR